MDGRIMGFKAQLRMKFNALSRWKAKEIVIIFVVAGILITTFALSPLPGGDDWETFRGSALRILEGSPLYGEKVTHGYYSNPPWVAFLLIPLSLLPFRWGWAILSIASLALLVVLCRRWKFGIWKTILVVLSPATFYVILHGEIDALVLAGILLPRETWILFALTKPQVAIGMFFGVGWQRVVKGIILTIIVLLLSFLFFGFWPLELIQQPMPFVDAAHNLFYGLWPFQIPAGLAILLWGIRRNDERFLIAASPLLSPYAATSSLLGPWMAIASYLKSWEASLVFLTWWAAVVYRMLGS
jgi:hypothetical protein